MEPTTFAELLDQMEETLAETGEQWAALNQQITEAGEDVPFELLAKLGTIDRGLDLQLAAARLVELRLQLRAVEAQESLAASQVSVAESLSIIAGQNAGGYVWQPSFGVEVLNAGDLR